jgi:hypothetical protein
VHNDYLWIHPGFVEKARSPGADDGLAVWREDTYDHTQHDLKPIPYDDQVLESLIALMGSKTGVPLADEREERATVDEVIQLLIGVQGTETASPEGEVSVPSDDWWQPTQDETEWVPGEDDGSPVSTAEHDSQLDTSTSSNLDWLVSSLTSIIQGTADELGDYDVSESGLADTIESILTAGEGEATYEPKDEDEAESSYDDIVWDIGADDGRPTTTADEE